MSGDRVIGAVGDLARAANCEFALLRAVDAALGNLPVGPDSFAPLLRSRPPAPELLAHFGSRLTRIPSPDLPGADPAARIAALTIAAARTADMVRAGAEAIVGAVFFDGGFACGVDLLLRTGDGPRYTMYSAVGSDTIGLPADLRRSVAVGVGGAVLATEANTVRPPAPGPTTFGRGGSYSSSAPAFGDPATGPRTATREPVLPAGPRDEPSNPGPLAGSRTDARDVGPTAGFRADARDPGPAAGSRGDVRDPGPAVGFTRADQGAHAGGGVGALDDPRALRREVAAGRTPFERAAASVQVVPVDPVREALCARLEFAAVARELASLGASVDPVARLSGTHGEERTAAIELAPLYRARRARVAHIIEDKLAELLPVQWGDPRYLACGVCPSCRTAVATARDLLLVAGIRPTQRARLREAGVLTVDRLATTSTPVPGLTPRTVHALRRQAEIQLHRERTGEPTYALRDATVLGALPAPCADDLALIIDLDDHGAVRTVELADAATVVHRPELPPVADAAVLDELLDIIAEHRAANPDVRVYHYGSAVRTALLDWSGRVGAGADLLDALLAAGALVDLAPIVRTAVLIGEQSYDITGLAALLPGTHSRAATVLALRDWLLDRAADAGIEVPGSRFAVAAADFPPSLRTGSLEAALTEFAADSTGDAARAAALTAAVLGYHRRERQPRWWAHIDRLGLPVGEWADEPGVLIADRGTVDTKWHRTPQLPTMRRYLTLTGRLGTGATLTPGTQMVTIYDGAAAAGMTQTLGRRATATATVLGCAVDADFDDTVRLEELLPAGCPSYDDLPAAIAPGPPDGEAEIEAALESTAQNLLVTLPRVPENAVYDLLLRRPPRLRDGLTLPEVHGDPAAALATAVGALESSYLAVHGPPGTGKTGTLGHAIERLVTRHRWRVGVVAQSHAVIERIFDAVVEAGLLPELVAKKDVASVGPEWSAIDAARYPRFLDNAVNGCVIGGTPADFVDDALILPGSLDLLVIADAGDTSIPDTVAVAVSARNLLLVGDPQPPRAQAAHPLPVQVSALGWLCEGARTLPATYGYFLDRTWRMHPAVCAPVSAGCYDGKLRASETVTLARDLAGIAPGVSTVLVEHRGSATESDAEAREVVRRVRLLLGETWTSAGRTRKLHPHDVFVVAPYAAQVARIRTLLARAKIEDVLVGTPDRFRGREAAVVLLSMTTSTPADAPFGMRALLSPTVLHATLSRAMWKAIILRSPLLTEYLPDTPEELSALNGFLRLGAEPTA
ncbi:bifunctional RecB family nuclease/DEAD/DEAH box helicase [Nocardia sp. AG03]|uniref:bifunctional RecB family nuclease/DEAD/DEAH box helicase n=1 Tax=Nocardia sp. AG03 TaxID=3025312 RepID=UPI0024185421|nr:bifunctional RecB family nuclease/DEAD/DEAH box helicase [Nocardia sp. AG03]